VRHTFIDVVEEKLSCAHPRGSSAPPVLQTYERSKRDWESAPETLPERLQTLWQQCCNTRSLPHCNTELANLLGTSRNPRMSKTRETHDMAHVATHPDATNNSGPLTTAIMRNLPHDYTREMLVALLSTEGFLEKCDFIYLPMEFGSTFAFGFAFVNLIGPVEAAEFCAHFQGFKYSTVPDEKAADIRWSESQGFSHHVDRFRNSPVMHESVPDEYKPIVLQKGVRISFPPATKKVARLRRLRTCRSSYMRRLGALSAPTSPVTEKASGTTDRQNE